MNSFQIMPSLCVAAFALALAVGCSKEATIDNINEAKASLLESLGLVNTEADETTEDIESAYSQLKTTLDEKNLTDDSIKTLEEHLESMKAKFEDLNPRWRTVRATGMTCSPC